MIFGRLQSFLLTALALMLPTAKSQSPNFGSRPNMIYLLVDDWGAGDVNMCPEDVDESVCPFRATGSRAEVLFTPRIKQMAAEGMIMTNWYAPRGLCTPSRAGLLAGRDPVHFAMMDPVVQLLGSPSMRGGFPQEETTVAEYLKDLGYLTAFSGKWHLGFTNGTDPVAHTPIRQGYDETFYFVEGSNGEVCVDGAMNPPGDNNLYHACAFDHVQHCDNVTMTCEVMEQPIRWENITSRHLAAGLDFLDRAAATSQPFFFSFHFLHVHTPWVPGRNFVSHPTLKHWTDMVGEVDWAVGALLDKLKKLGIDENTMVILTSDNGPYLESASSFCPQNCKIPTPEMSDVLPEGFMCTPCDSVTVSLPGPRTGGKGMTWEGGQHVPGVFWWPGTIPAGTINPVVSSQLDFLPTAVALAGGSTKNDTYLDGHDLSYTIFTTPDPTATPNGTFVYWCGTYAMAVRVNQYKVIWKSQKFVGKSPNQPTSKTFCAGTGNCCVDTPTRLCNCQWANNYTASPIVIDLLTNPYEDHNLALNATLVSTMAIVDEATEIRTKRVKSVLDSRGITYDGLDVEQMLAKLSLTPDLMQIDFCQSGEGFIEIPPNDSVLNTCLTNASSWIVDGCNVIPPECQLPDFAPYENCSITTQQGAKCQKRLPCGQQDGYMGPFEYVRPEGSDWDDGSWELCGAYKYGPNSYFPDDPDLQASVCTWQDDVNAYLTSIGALPIAWCRLPACANATTDNDQVCENIFKYGLNNVPSGNIYNSPYPDDQTDLSLMYPNQKFPPNNTAQVKYPTNCLEIGDSCAQTKDCCGHFRSAICKGGSCKPCSKRGSIVSKPGSCCTEIAKELSSGTYKCKCMALKTSCTKDENCCSKRCVDGQCSNTTAR